MKKDIKKICSRCILDETVPDIEFDSKGECNYCKLHDKISEEFPTGKKGEKILEKIVLEIKKEGRNRNFDCIVGVSGGSDSTFLIDLAKSYGLRPLAVHLDNGWNSRISVSNIKKSLEKLNVDLITYVIDWPEIKDILLSFLKASLPWADGPTDIAILSTLYKTAAKENVRYILVGNNFRTEGRQPEPWTHVDGKMISYVTEKFAHRKLKSFPNLTMTNLVYYGIVKGIKMIRPLCYLDYDKEKAKKDLIKKYDWEDYGGHHHESIFTRFIIGYWLTKKFGIDKRKITYSALIRTGQMKRGEGLKKIAEPPYAPKKMQEDKEYVAKKLGITLKEFEEIFKRPNKTFMDYPSYYPIYQKYGKVVKMIFKYILPWKPLMFFELEKKNP